MFHIILAAAISAFSAASALREFRKGNTGWGWYYNGLGLIAVVYFWLLILAEVQ